jgi:hypothetical protein
MQNARIKKWAPQHGPGVFVRVSMGRNEKHADIALDILVGLLTTLLESPAWPVTCGEAA